MGPTVRELCPAQADPADSLPWFAVVIKPQHERTAYEGLRQRGMESFLPTYRATRRWSDRLKQLEVPLFPGYVFCRFEKTRKVPVLRTPGVRAIVSSGSEMLPIPGPEIDRVRQMVAGSAGVEPWPFLKTGQKVRVCDGPLVGLEGILSELRNAAYVVVGIDLLQRSVAVQLSRAQIRPA